jgi:hypothetical protein
MYSGNGHGNSVDAGEGLRQLGETDLRSPPGPRIATSVLSVCVRGVDLPCAEGRARRVRHRPWEGWGAATARWRRLQAGFRQVSRMEGFGEKKVWALKPRRPAPTPENVGQPPKLGPPPVPVTFTYVLPGIIPTPCHPYIIDQKLKNLEIEAGAARTASGESANAGPLPPTAPCPTPAPPPFPL